MAEELGPSVDGVKATNNCVQNALILAKDAFYNISIVYFSGLKYRSNQAQVGLL